MWTKTGIAGILVSVLLGNILEMHGQGFDWRVIYGDMQYGSNPFQQELRISEAGMIYSRITYWDLPPFQWDTGHVLEKRDPSGNRLWSHVLYGGDYSSLRFDHDAEENVYLLEARSDSSVNIVAVPGNRFIAGGRFGGTQVIFEIDSEGNELWRMPTDVIYTFSLLESGPGGELFLGNVHYDLWACLAKYSRHLVEVDALRDHASAADGFALSQNYPNPFNPSTTISFSIPSRGEVSLTVFDHLGREVAVLAHGEYQAGTHSCQFTGTELPSGVYMYRLDWNGNSVARRMVLLR